MKQTFVQTRSEVITIPRLSKKAKREWDLFLDLSTGRRSYNELCRRCTTLASKVFAPLWWLVPTMKASEKKGAEKRTKPPQFPKMDCGEKSIRRRNKRAAHEKKTAKQAPFSYRKRHLAVSPHKRRKSALTQLR